MNFFDPFGMTNKLQGLLGGGNEEGYEELQKMLQQGTDKMDQYGKEGVGYLSPFRDAGLGQTGNLKKAIANMMNPGQFYSDMMSGYQQSPMAQRQHEMGLNDSMAAASASGMTGSSDLMRQVNEQSQNITNQDMQKYFGNMMGIYDQGLNTSQNMYNTGYGAASGMGSIMSNLGQSIANMYGQMGQAKMGQAQAGNQGLMGMLGGLGGLMKALPAGGLLGALAL